MGTPWTQRQVSALWGALVLGFVVILCGACSSADFGDLAANRGYLQATSTHVLFLQWVKRGTSISGSLQDDDPSTGHSSVSLPLTGSISGNTIMVTFTNLAGTRRTWTGSIGSSGLSLGVQLGKGSATSASWALASIGQANSAVQHLNTVITKYFPSDHLQFPGGYSVTSVTGDCSSASNCRMFLEVSPSSGANTVGAADLTWRAQFDQLGWDVTQTPEGASSHGDDYSFSGYGWDGHFLVAQKGVATVAVGVWLQTCGSSCSPADGSRVTFPGTSDP